MDNKTFFNIKEAADFLNLSEAQIRSLIKKGQLTAYQIGGTYLRLKFEELKNFKQSERSASGYSNERDSDFSLLDGVKDFFYFNDFYILAVLIIVFLVLIIFKNII